MVYTAVAYHVIYIIRGLYVHYFGQIVSAFSRKESSHLNSKWVLFRKWTDNRRCFFKQRNIGAFGKVLVVLHRQPRTVLNMRRLIAMLVFKLCTKLIQKCELLFYGLDLSFLRACKVVQTYYLNACKLLSAVDNVQQIGLIHTELASVGKSEYQLHPAAVLYGAIVYKFCVQSAFGCKYGNAVSICACDIFLGLVHTRKYYLIKWRTHILAYTEFSRRAYFDIRKLLRQCCQQKRVRLYGIAKPDPVTKGIFYCRCTLCEYIRIKYIAGRA